MLPPMALWMLLSCLMLVSQVKGEDIQNEHPNVRISCPKGSMAYSSYCYALYTKPTSWMDAEIACQKRPSGHLASILTGSEASFVSALIKNNFSLHSYVWIGIHDPTEGLQPNGGGWEWSNTDVMNYHAWEKDPPSSPDFGYCGTVTQNSGFRKWKDYNCRKKLPYICKFKN